jgi:small-conductance mechanosensitive channel
LHWPTFLTIFFVGLVWATGVLGLPAPLTRVTTGLIWTLLILVWLKAGIGTCRYVLDSLSHYRDRFTFIESRTIPLLDMTAKLVLAGGAVYAVLLVWNIDPTAWLASAGIIGIAVGFAAKDTLANLFSGFFILADAPYKIGDFIILDTGERGRVTQVGLRSTRLLTRDDIEITVPNAVIGNAKIVNESGGPYEKERIRCSVGVAYGSDVDQVCEVLERLAVNHDHICADPEPRVRLRQFGDSGINFELLAWIDEPVLRGKLSHELNMEIYKEFGRLGIEIPFPKRDVYVRQLPQSDAG